MAESPKQPTQSLTGDAAWQATKREVSKRNEAAFARGREERAARDAGIRAERRVADERELKELQERAKRFS